MLHSPKPAPRKRDPQSHPQCRTCPLILLLIFRRHERCNLVANSYTQLPLSSLTLPETALLVQEHHGLVCAAFVLCSSFSVPPQLFSLLCGFPIAYQLVFLSPSTGRQHIPRKEKQENQWNMGCLVRQEACQSLSAPWRVLLGCPRNTTLLFISPSIWNGSCLLWRSSQQALCSLRMTNRCRRPRPLLPSLWCSGTLLGMAVQWHGFVLLQVKLLE